MDVLFMLYKTNPNLVYLTLILGLWVGVTAIYIPGTLVPELVALVLLGLALAAMLMMTTNWLAALLIVIGALSFLLTPLVNPLWARFAEVGLIPQAVGGLFLFGLGDVSLVTILVTVLVAVIYHRLALLPILRGQQEMARRSEQELNLVGMHGRVVSPLDPTGTVRVNGELWTARSTDRIDNGAAVVVTGREGLELIVEKAKRGSE